MYIAKWSKETPESLFGDQTAKSADKDGCIVGICAVQDAQEGAGTLEAGAFAQAGAGTGAIGTKGAGDCATALHAEDTAAFDAEDTAGLDAEGAQEVVGVDAPGARGSELVVAGIHVGEEMGAGIGVVVIGGSGLGL